MQDSFYVLTSDKEENRNEEPAGSKTKSGSAPRHETVGSAFSKQSSGGFAETKATWCMSRALGEIHRTRTTGWNWCLYAPQPIMFSATSAATRQRQQ